MEALTPEMIIKFIDPKILILIPVLVVLGLIIKNIPNIKDWTIPIILGINGVVFAILIICLPHGFTPENILSGVIQGILAAGMAVYVHQIKVQTVNKRKE